jgi:hypothetical protein
MQNNFEFSVTFRLEVEVMNANDVSLQMRKYIDDIRVLTGGVSFEIDLLSITSEKYELLYTKGIDFYRVGMNIIRD